MVPEDKWCDFFFPLWCGMRSIYLWNSSIKHTFVWPLKRQKNLQSHSKGSHQQSGTCFRKWSPWSSFWKQITAPLDLIQIQKNDQPLKQESINWFIMVYPTRSELLHQPLYCCVVTGWCSGLIPKEFISLCTAVSWMVESQVWFLKTPQRSSFGKHVLETNFPETVLNLEKVK